MNIIILIPTYNRPSKLKRSLEYYQHSGIPVFVADGSEKVYTGEIPQNVSYFHLPSLTYSMRVLKVIERVSLPHVVLAADDDFVLPDFVRQADALLSKRIDYSAVFGRCYAFHEDFPEKWRTRYTWASAIEEEDTSSRLRHFFSRYYPLFYVPTRTKLLQEVLSTFSEYELRAANLVELMFAARLVIAGKVAILDELYSAREDATEKVPSFPYPSVQKLFSEDPNLLHKIEEFTSHWLDAACSNNFRKNIYSPYVDIFIPWYENMGRISVVKRVFHRILKRPPVNYYRIDTFSDKKGLHSIQQIIMKHCETIQHAS